MKKIKILLLMIPLITFSCLVDDEALPLEKDLSETPYTVGFEKSSEFVTYVADGETQTLRVYVNIFGGLEFTTNPQQDIAFEVDPASTAAAGTQYDFVSPSNSVTIDADREFAFFDINIYTENLNTDNADTLILNMTSASNATIADQFKTMTINLQGSCFSDLAGSYTLTVTSSSGNSYSGVEEITPAGEGRYHTVTTGTWGPGVLQGSGATNEWYYFTDVCDQILVEDQTLADNFFSNTVTGVDIGGGINGSVNPETGVIHVEYEISFTAGNVTYSADYVPND